MAAAVTQKMQTAAHPIFVDSDTAYQKVTSTSDMRPRPSLRSTLHSSRVLTYPGKTQNWHVAILAARTVVVYVKLIESSA